VVAADACTHEMTAELAEGYLRPLQIASMLDAPIQQGGQTVGVLCIEHGPDMRYWAAGEITFVDTLAEFIGMQLEARSRERLLESTNRLASIIEATPDLVFIIKLDGEVLYLNQAGYRLLGLPEGEPLRNINAMEFVAPEQVAYRQQVIIPQVMREGRWSGEVEIITRRGERIPIWEDFIAHRDTDGRVRHLSAVVRDLRMQKEAENALRQREQALSRLNDELEERVRERTRKIEEANKNLETFAFSVSHDLKAPLRGIDGYSRLLMEDYKERLPDEAQGFIGNIRQAAQSMSELIDDLLAYSRVGRRELSRSHFSIHSAVQRVLQERAHDIEAQKVAVVDDIDAIDIDADLDCFLQIVRNLIDNAVKFTRQTPQPRIELRTQVHAKHLVFSVKDNGCGFDMKYHDRIFSIFQRLHRSEDYPGTGVGLAIVSKAAERLGGRVWAQSTLGRGAEFYLELPLSHD
jgi:PAS domain S-box-containing protein